MVVAASSILKWRLSHGSADVEEQLDAFAEVLDLEFKADGKQRRFSPFLRLLPRAPPVGTSRRAAELVDDW